MKRTKENFGILMARCKRLDIENDFLREYSERVTEEAEEITSELENRFGLSKFPSCYTDAQLKGLVIGFRKLIAEMEKKRPEGWVHYELA